MPKSARHEDVEIEDIDAKGYGVARRDGYQLLVEGALPGDRVDVAVVRRKSKRAICRVTSVRSQRIERVEAVCVHFADCGGCTIQDIPYETQLELKERLVNSSFLRFGIDNQGIPEGILRCKETEEYRNRLDYSFSARRWITREEAAGNDSIGNFKALGFHAPRRFDKVLAIERCHLQPEPSNRVRNAVRDWTDGDRFVYYDSVVNSGLLRSLVVRTTLLGEVLVLLVFEYDEPTVREELTAKFLETFPEITSLFYMINPSKNDSLTPHPAHLASGSPTIRERCAHITLLIDAKSFYQTNPLQAERLYELIAEWAHLDGTEELLDLYCGIGSIGLFLASRCRRVLGIELSSDSIARARENALLNGIENIDFRVGAAEEELPEMLAELNYRPDLVIVDPPRAGLHPRVIESLIAIGAKRIIYVSCNPTSQAENISNLQSDYVLSRSRAVDMFPHTRHVENVVELRRRESKSVDEMLLANE